MTRPQLRTITRLDFRSAWRDVSIAFSLWKAEQAGVIAVGSSPEQARARLAAKLETKNEGMA